MANEHVAAANIQLQADEILADLFSTVEAFGSAIVGQGKHGVLTLPYFEQGTAGIDESKGWIECYPCDDGYLVRYRQLHGESYTQVITYDQANKVC